jgi:hypothetical protein
MPGLIRGVARTAVIAGTATAVSNRVSRRQAGRWAEQDQAAAYEQQQAYAQQQQYAAPPPQPVYAAPPPPPPAPAPAAAPEVDLVAELTRLGSLRDSGILTDEEFAAAKAKLLG